MFRKFFFTAVAVLAFVGLAAAPSSAQYEQVQPALTVSKAQVAQGNCFVLTGTGLDPNTTYELGSIYEGPTTPAARSSRLKPRALPNSGNTRDLGTVTTDAKGSFTSNQGVLANAELGTYSIGIDTKITETPQPGTYSAITTVDYEVIAGNGTSDCPAVGPISAPATTAPRPGVSAGTLARTGSSTMPIAAAGLGLVAAGGGLLLVSRRRRIA
jgi:LPXTG-motif cell wall-anchored protein